MAVAALGVLGAAGASALGVSAGIGYLVGSTLGSLLFAETTSISGPKLSDTSTNISSYGSFLPIVYGRHLVVGNIFWATDKIPTEHTEEQGGKGGPTTTVTTTTYHVDMAVAFCEETTQLSRLYANNNLIADYRALGTVHGWLSAMLGVSQYIVYTGTTTQQPNSLLEAALGAGNVPAYRGTTYLVARRMQLEEYGNQIPQMSAEVVVSGTVAPARQFYNTAYYPVSGITHDGDFGGAITQAGQWIMFERNTEIVGLSQYQITAYAPDDPDEPDIKSTTSLYVGGMPSIYWHMCCSCSQVPAMLVSEDGVAQRFIFVNPADPNFLYGGRVFNVEQNDTNLSYQGVRQYATWSQYEDRLAVAIRTGGVVRLSVWDYYTGELKYTIYTGANSSSHMFVGPLAIYVSNGTDTEYYDRDTGALLGTIPTANGYPSSTGLEWYVDDEGKIWAWGHSQATAKVWYLDASNVWQVAYSGTEFSAFYAGTNAYRAPFVLRSGMLCAVARYYLTWRALIINLNAVSDTGVTVATIADDICDRTGITANTAGLTGSVDGFAITRTLSGRQALDTLRTITSFDATVDTNLKLVSRSGTSVAQLESTDLGAGSDEPSGQNVTIYREQPLDTPTVLQLNFSDNEAEYVLNSAIKVNPRASLPDTEIIDASSFAMTPDRAAQLADIRLAEMQQAQTKVSFSTNLSFFHYEPTDVITVVTKDDLSYTVQLTSKVLSGGKISWEGVQCTATSYTSTASGSGANTLSGSKPKFPPALRVLDIPMLRSADNTSGVYVAVAAASTASSSLYTGETSGTSTYQGTTSSSALMGVATTILGTTSGLDCIDEVNTVNVMFSSGTPASCTTAALLHQDNIYQLGSEIIAARTATLVSGSTYTLSGLLRGLYGTERYVSTHGYGESCTGLDVNAGLFRVSVDYLDPLYYRAVATGGAINKAMSVLVSNSGVSIKPYAPCRLVLGNDGSTGRKLSWSRRTRLNINTTAYEGHPLGEQAEQYNVYIYSSNTYATILRVYGATSETFTYTLTMATADYGSMPATLHWGVGQVSAIAGVGTITNISTAT